MITWIKQFFCTHYVHPIAYNNFGRPIKWVCTKCKKKFDKITVLEVRQL